MTYLTLISANDLVEHLSDPAWSIVDCRFSLDDTEMGREAYEEAHIPGAVYAHLDKDLSGPIIPGRSGRHPLPEPQTLAQTFGSWGIGAGQQVIAYDSSGGGIAARLWWLLRWLGHDEVAVLDGGWQAWQRQGYAVRSGVETAQPRTFVPRVRDDLTVDAGQVEELRQAPGFLLADSRAAERYRGESEPLDAVAGHIPGAVSVPYAGNLDADGRFRGVQDLRQRFEGLLQGMPSDHAVFYCGSGVTAAHNVLTLAHAGFGDARLYPGSWSEWITDPSRPVATGAEQN